VHEFLGHALYVADSATLPRLHLRRLTGLAKTLITFEMWVNIFKHLL
jgi:hypothetical protein